MQKATRRQNVPDLSQTRSAVSVIALRQRGVDTEVLLLKRTQTLIGEWCQVAGGIEPGEMAWQAALRELREETGLVPSDFYSADTCEQFYDADDDTIHIIPVFVAFISTEAEVQLNHEHSEYCWISFEQARALVSFGGQRRVLSWVEEEFVNRIASDHLRIEPS